MNTITLEQAAEQMLKAAEQANNQLQGCAAWLSKCDQEPIASGTRSVSDDLSRAMSALRQALNVAPPVNALGVCSECGREYDDITNTACPSDDCPSHDPNPYLLHGDELTRTVNNRIAGR